MTVKWNNFLSRTVPVKSGIRQGVILSPVFYNIYIDDVINSLQESDLSCHLGKEYVGCIVYADDILLLSASVVQLQRMLHLCVECGDKLDIIFNASKSVLFKVGKVFREKLDNLYLGMKVLCWCDHFKYLGTHFISDPFLKADISQSVRKFMPQRMQFTVILDLYLNFHGCLFLSRILYHFLRIVLAFFCQTISSENSMYAGTTFIEMCLL